VESDILPPVRSLRESALICANLRISPALVGSEGQAKIHLVVETLAPHSIPVSSSPFRRKTVRILWTVVRCYLLVVVVLAIFQRKLIYLPSHQSEAAMLRYAESFQLEPWRDKAGMIIGWKTPASAGAPRANRLVVFHGNAGYALLRTHFVDGFGGLGAGRLWDVHLFEYPGFGAREGKLGEESFIQAGAAALEELAANDSRPIFLLGESLGSGLACALAARNAPRIAGVFLLTPYSSLAEVAAFHYPAIPVRLILRDRWDNRTALSAYPGRIAIRLAGDDEIIPVAQGQALYDVAPGPRKLWIQDSAGHNGTNFDRTAPWWEEVSEFLVSDSPRAPH
jgi:uncharacterized protein